jgi:hypothetical protein
VIVGLGDATWPGVPYEVPAKQPFSMVTTPQPVATPKKKTAVAKVIDAVKAAVPDVPGLSPKLRNALLVGAAIAGAYFLMRGGGGRSRTIARNPPRRRRANPRPRRKAKTVKVSGCRYCGKMTGAPKASWKGICPSCKQRLFPHYVQNPRTRHADPDVQKAIDFRKAFHWGYPARRVSTVKVYPRPKAMTQLGEVVAIRYRTNKKGEKARVFHHDFEQSRPKLGMDVRNKRLHFFGGGYTVTPDGITG